MSKPDVKMFNDGKWSVWSGEGNCTRDAAYVLKKAASLIDGDRDRQHGNRRDMCTKIGAIWDVYLKIRRDPTAPISPHDVAEMMSLLKKVRKQQGYYNPDDGIDDLGYTAIAAELEEWK